MEQLNRVIKLAEIKKELSEKALDMHLRGNIEGFDKTYKQIEMITDTLDEISQIQTDLVL